MNKTMKKIVAAILCTAVILAALSFLSVSNADASTETAYKTSVNIQTETISVTTAAETAAENVLSTAISAAVSETSESVNEPVSAESAETESASSEVQVERITIQSVYLGKKMNVNVYLPGDYDTDKEYAVLYLFHGYNGDEDTWEENMDLIETATKVFSEGKSDPYIIVTPDIERSYGINSSSESANFNSGEYENYIVNELINYIDTHYSTITSREGRYIGGLSMGGYAALHICFDHPELFSKAGGHSPALWTSSNSSLAKKTLAWLYPTEELQYERDPLLTVSDCDLSGVKIWLDCGTEDGYKLYIGTKELYNTLFQKGADAEYHSWSGTHKSSYWKAHLEEYLIFYGSN